IYLLKYTSAGSLLWARGGGSPGLDVLSDLFVDGAGNIYLTGLDNFIFGFSESAMTLDGVTREGPGGSGSDIFLAKYTASGTLDWLKIGGSTYFDGVSPDVFSEFGFPRIEVRGSNLYLGANFGAGAPTSQPYSATFDGVTLAGTK